MAILFGVAIRIKLVLNKNSPRENTCRFQIDDQKQQICLDLLFKFSANFNNHMVLRLRINADFSSSSSNPLFIPSLIDNNMPISSVSSVDNFRALIFNFLATFNNRLAFSFDSRLKIIVSKLSSVLDFHLFARSVSQ